MLVKVNQSKHVLYSSDLREKLHKMADGREATFQFIEEAQNCPDLWDVSPAAYKDMKNKHVVRSKGRISTDIRFRPNLSNFPALSVSFSARTKTQAATLREYHCTLHRPCCKLPCVEI